MFKFNFDVEADNEQSVGSLGGNFTTRSHGPTSAQSVIPDAFTELSLADAVCPNTAQFSSVFIAMVARIS